MEREKIRQVRVVMTIDRVDNDGVVETFRFNMPRIRESDTKFDRWLDALEALQNAACAFRDKWK